MPKFNEPRLKFLVGEQNLFIKKTLCITSTKNLSKLANVSTRTISDWRSEKYHIPERVIKIICEKYDIGLPENIDQLRENWKLMRKEISTRGAIAKYKIYGNFSTPEGRRKGGHNALQILRKRGVAAWCSKEYLYPKKSVDLAEFVGILLGDGGITKEQVTITLNTEVDKEYVNYVSSLGNRLFGQKPHVSDRKDCKATNLRYSGIKLIEFLIKSGLKSGDKVKQQVDVPNWIKSSIKYKISCLRGLMDTDGCISICTHNYKSKSYVYYNPCFANRSKPLLNFVTNTLTELNLRPSVAGERIWLYNKASVRDYFRIVSSSNYRLLKFKQKI
jgi:intein/homing endonuclease